MTIINNYIVYDIIEFLQYPI